ncbi:MAG: LysM peptidoglycan-binding domain-containing protein [Bacteroidetes bacterium]|nr:LysM peptidoglycan-binding domain-containing protein [Bacteroidota bacterium]
MTKNISPIYTMQIFAWLMLFCLNLNAQVEVPQEGNDCEDEPEFIALDDTTLSLVREASDYDSSFIYTINDSLVKDENLIRAGLLYDLESNTIVWEKEMNTAYPIASVTKIMVALIIIEDIEAGRLKWTDKITTTHYKYVGKRKRKRKVYFHNTYSLRDMLKMVMIESNNYAAELVATHAGNGSMYNFIKRMNTKAAELGMLNTQYSNPSGLPARTADKDNHASPHDLLLLAKVALKNKALMEIANMGYAEVYNGRNHYCIRNHNGLTRDFVNEVDGIKTGFTTRAGFCLVSSMRRYNHRLIAIVLGAHSSYSRNAFIANMASNYYESIKLGPLGIKLNDSCLAAVKPNLNNADFNYPSIRINPYYMPQSAPIDNTLVTFKTVYVQAKKYHKVKYGETLSGIADKYNVGMSQLKSWNKLRSTNIRSGQRLAIVTTIKKQIPVASQDMSNSTAGVVNDTEPNDNNENTLTGTNVAKHTKTAVESKVVGSVKGPKEDSNSVLKTGAIATEKKYSVKPKDGLFAIAKKYNCTVTQLKEWNNLKSENIEVGQVLVVAPGNNTNDNLASNSLGDTTNTKITAEKKLTNTKSQKIKFVYHTVQPGDTLWTIAQKYAGVTVSEIKKLNGIRNHKSLLPGTKVKVPLT